MVVPKEGQPLLEQGRKGLSSAAIAAERLAEAAWAAQLIATLEGTIRKREPHGATHLDILKDLLQQAPDQTTQRPQHQVGARASSLLNEKKRERHSN